MAINTSRLNLDGGQDEVVSNQRVRAYVPGDPVAMTAMGTLGPVNPQYGTLWMMGTGAPTSFASGSQTYTAAMIGGGLIVHKNTGIVNGTLDTTANIITYLNATTPSGFQVGDIYQFQVFNTGSGILTIVPGDVSTTPDGNGISTIPAGVSKTINLRLATATTIVYYM